MNTDQYHRFDPRPVINDVLEHPLVGLERRRTLVAVAILTVLLGLFAVRYAGMTVAIDGRLLETVRTAWFDELSAAVIAVAAATITVLPFCYAAWNGGPALSFVMPLVPVVLGDLAAGRYVLTLDAAIALTVGAAASALALFVAGVRRTGRFRSWRSAPSNEPRLLFVTVVTVAAAVAVGRFVIGAPPRYLQGYAPFGVLWVVPLTVVGRYWIAAIRTAAATPSDRARSRS